MTRHAPDLTTCDQEAIRIPGSIQPHGFLLALSPALTVLQASANLGLHAGVEAAHAAGLTLTQVLGDGAAALAAAVAHAGTARRPPSQPHYMGNLALPGGGRYDALLHAADGLLMLEFERVDRAGPADFHQLYTLVGEFLQRSGDAATDAGSGGVDAMCAQAAREIQRLTGFGRVLVYRFDDQGHGDVLAEENDGSLPSCLGQHFPASDIPAQARELYTLNRIRLIGDANYAPAPLVPERNPLTGAPTDLSFAALRSVSPVHLQYMRNMGTLASMSVSLLVKGKLWGMVSCHNTQPARLDFEQRTACEQLGQILALRIESREVADELQFRLDVRQAMVSALGGLTQGSDFIDNMRNVFPALLHFARAGGVAIVVDERIASYGGTPDEAAIGALVDWLALNTPGDLYHTDRLGQVWPPAAAPALVRHASGLLAMPISRIHKHYLLWFRPEQIYNVDWAGNPNGKAAQEPAGNAADGADGPQLVLTPRRSFATWRETVHGTSRAWHPAELELALEFRTALLGIALERAEQMAELAEELGRANKELEAFSYSVSHDLRAPLRHIVGYSDLLLEEHAAADPAKRLRFLRNIKEAAQLAGKLVDDLLSFSQMGRAALRPVRTELGELVQSCIDRLAIETRGRNIAWRFDALPAVCADPAFLQLALYNLLSNAVKFTARQDPAQIAITATDDRHETVLRVADNGVGFNMAYVHKLFGVFQRLHRIEDFHGTGIGLANVRRIIERHGGRVWAESVPGQGAVFSFSIPKQIPAE